MNEMTKSFKFESKEDLEKITIIAGSLFSSDSQTSLAEGISDYWIDQVLMKVNALSDDVFFTEKEQLRQLVNRAKQLSRVRNVLVGGSFETLEKWKLSRNAVLISNGSNLFHGKYLRLPHAVEYTSYAHQKIEENKLKANTRYYVSVFIAQGYQLEIMVSRYGQEYSQIVYVPSEAALPISSDEQPNCCTPHPCTCRSCDDPEVDPHFLRVPIDVGSLELGQNLGIEIGFKVSSTKGNAEISNIEVYEERPLTEQEQRKALRRENKWKSEEESKANKRAQLLQQMQETFDHLYTTPEHHTLRLEASYQQLLETTVPMLPNVYHWFMSDVPGDDYAINYKAQQKLKKAWNQYFSRNIVTNGDFLEPLEGMWMKQGSVLIRSVNNNSMLLLQYWDSSVTQNVSLPVVNEDAEYLIRVLGKGTGRMQVKNGNTIHAKTFTNLFGQMEVQELYITPEDAQISITLRSDADEFLVDTVEVILIDDGANEEM